MKQKIIFCILVLIFSITLLSCQKDVSREGTPPWLEDGISKKCIYKNEVVYYVISPCCDAYNYLYDNEGNIICAPDGGLTGKGDGKCPDFSLENQCGIK